MSIRDDSSYTFRNLEDHNEEAQSTQEVASLRLAQTAQEPENAQITNDVLPSDAEPAAGPQAPQPQQTAETGILTANANNEVTLPEGTSLEKIEISGQDLLITQQDGTVLTIKDAVLNVPTFILGSVQIPPDTLIAAFQSNNINVAAGPNGNLVASNTGSNSSGNNFAGNVPDIGDAGPVIDLLPYTDLQFPTLERVEIIPSEDVDNPIAISATSITEISELSNEGGLDISGAQTDYGSDEDADPTNNLTNSETSGTGSISIDAPDGIGSIAINGTTITGVGQTIAGTNGYLTILTFDTATGQITYNYTLILHTDHPLTSDVVTEEFTVQATDSNGDTASTTFSVGILDDTPSITRNATAVPTLVTDDSALASGNLDTGAEQTTDSADFSSLFDSVFGADGGKDDDDDGVADSDAVRYQMAISTSASGLVDSLTGEAVTLSINAAGTLITGASATGGTVFTISLDPDTGTITQTQIRAVEHDDPADPSEATAPSVLSGVSITLTATVEDGDGDTQSASTDIAAAFTFEDDGPSITRNATAVPTLVTDDSALASGNLDTGAEQTTDSADFSSLFDSVFGADGGKDDDDDGVADSDAVRYQMAISTSASGLVDSLTGEAVTLSINAAGTLITGASATGGTVFTISLDPDTGTITQTQIRAVEHDDPADPSEATAPSVLSGVSITLTATVEDGDGDTQSASTDIAAAFTFEDDGPSITRNATAVPTLVTDDSALASGNLDTGAEQTTDSADFSSLFDSVFGADGGKDDDDDGVADSDAVRYQMAISTSASGLVDSLTGEAVTLSINAAGTLITGASATGGTVFTISLDPDTGTITQTQIRAVEHDDPADPSEATAPSVLSGVSITLTATVEDGDGDTQSASTDIAAAFTFEDDGPSITRNATAVPTLVTDDSALASGNLDTGAEQTTDSADFSSLFDSVFGADGGKDDDDDGVADSDAVRYQMAISTSASGLVDSLTGEAVTLSINAAGTLITGASATGGTVFTISLDPDTGTITQTQIRAVEHDDPADPSEATAPSVLSGVSITLTATVEDGDGDTQSASTDIAAAFTFEDDGPSITRNATAVPTLVTDDSALASGNLDTGAEQTTDSADFSSLFDSVFGADGGKDDDDDGVADSDAVRYQMAISTSASGLVDSLTGEAVTLSINAAGTLITGASATGGTVFTISLDPDTGTITQTQIRAVEHDDPADPSEATAPSVLSGVSITLTATVEDGDGDTQSASTDIAAAFTFEDDGPSITRNATAVPTLVTDDSALASGNLDTGAEQTTDSADFSSLFDSVFGADGGKDDDDDGVADSDAVRYQMAISTSASGLVDSLTGEAVTLSINAAGTLITGASATGGTVFTISLDPDTGTITQTQIRAVEHDDPADPSEATAPSVLSGVSITLTATVEDGDGDTQSASTDIAAAFTFEDDGPSITISLNQLAPLATDESVGEDDGLVNFAAPDDEDGETDPFGLRPTMIGYALLVASAITTSASYGADGSDGNAPVLTLTASDGSGLNGTATGLTDSATGRAIHLFTELDGSITGRVANGDGTANSSGVIAFVVGFDLSGNIVLVQYSALHHPDSSNPDDFVSLTNIFVTASITDGDGDSASSTTASALDIVFEDDGPAAIQTENAYLLNSSGATFTGDLDLDVNIDDNVGQDQLGSITFASGMNGANSGFTSGGAPIYYTLINGSQTLIAYTGATVPTTIASAGVVFYVTLDTDGALASTSDTYSVTMVGTVDGGATEISFTDGGYDPAGGNLDWNGFVPTGDVLTVPKKAGDPQPVDNNSSDLLITPVATNPATPSYPYYTTINNTANGFGTGGGGGGQNIGSGEGIRLDFVTDLVGNPASTAGDYTTTTNQDHMYDGHYGVNGAFVSFGSIGTSSTVRFYTKIDDDSDLPAAPGTYPTVGDGANETIMSITVSHMTNSLTTPPTYTTMTFYRSGGDLTGVLIGTQSYDITWNGDGSVDVAGLSSPSVSGTSYGDNVSINTASNYNSLEVHYVSGDAFVLSEFGATAIDPGAAVDIQLDLSLTDSDGDIFDGTLNLSMLPPDPLTTANFTTSASTTYILGTEQHAIGSYFDDTITGNAGDNVIAGLDGIDTLFGLAGDDVLDGGYGDDILDGGLDDDLLIGGAGEDTMTGGDGADTFVIDLDSLDASITDLITDYDKAEGDIVDLSAVLEALGTPPIDAAGADAVVDLAYDGGSNTTAVIVDYNGTDVEVATLNDAHATISILFNDTDAPTDVS
ncbi:DUF5801 repeats-in-toxin domain-containing protein [uncultured Cohaesibacter sp.]|uniref:DUF5801 repeats-in-toxin domain-containing protein n=1 Tax=uncultured Cohaesibacter sp. TaxID=1002546 RepID=UPI0029C66834|nr:DUF5801 repeats-in-toxin domain-containing protein [uncultured Cohaesibacter sp.]